MIELNNLAYFTDTSWSSRMDKPEYKIYTRVDFLMFCFFVGFLYMNSVAGTNNELKNKLNVSTLSSPHCSLSPTLVICTYEFAITCPFPVFILPHLSYFLFLRVNETSGFIECTPIECLCGA